MFHDSFKQRYWREFSSYQQGAEFFHVTKATVRRWLTGKIPINPMAEKLLLIKSLGYYPMISVGRVFASAKAAHCSLLRPAVNSALKNWIALCIGATNT